MEQRTELIRTVDLHKSFGKLQVLKGVSETIHSGEVVSVIGPSGGGKSTFLRCLNLLETPEQGQIFFEGVEITGKRWTSTCIGRRWAWCSSISTCSPTCR